jgi:protease secretion system outer membrane protein
MRARLLLLLIALCACCAQVQAGPLTEALAQARRYDAQYLQALAERDANQNNADQAGTAYFPTFQGSYTQLETESSTRHTYTLTQPLVSADRYATWQESEPRERLATATFEQREQDLSQRLLKAWSELLRNHEGLRLNRAKIEALEKQAQSARRAFELGQGTVTDVRDAQVRLDQARADTLTLEAQIGAARRQLSAITGQPAQALQLDVPRASRTVVLQPLESYLDSGLKSNPPLRVARENQRLAEINVQRADWAVLPTVSAVAMRTESAGVQNNYAGVSVSLPLQAGSYYQMKGAAANASKSQEATRDAELRTRLEVERLWTLVRAGLAETEIRLEAIRSAELSVEANERSFRGGVRSQIDVLNSIQTLYQVQQDYVSAVLTLADNYLNLLLQSAAPVDTAVAQVQTVLFPTP